MTQRLTAMILAVVFASTLVSCPRFVGERDVRAAFSEIVVPDQYSTIQEAISHAFDGDTIFVKAGTYYEHVVVNKTVSLIGEDVSTTIIDGNNTGHVINVVRDNVNITGFTVQRSGNMQSPTFDAGICLNGTVGCIISEILAIDNGFCGISLQCSQHNIVAQNNLSGVGYFGIWLRNSSENTVSRNMIDNKYGGITSHQSSNYNNITENVISNSDYGMFYHAGPSYNNICGNNISTIAVEGIELQEAASFNTVAQNNVIGCGVGINLIGPNCNNSISGNSLVGCHSGIRIQDAGYTEIYNNTIAHNYGSDEWDAGVRLDSAAYSRIYSNEITDNGRGIVLYISSSYVSIYNNNVTSNDYGIRVAMGGSNYVNVSENYVANNRGYGIDVTGFGGVGESNYATIARNLIMNNTFEAVGLGIGSNYNTVFQNNMIGNGHAAVTLERYSNYNTIIQNNMIENAYGICFDLYTINSTQNTIINNNMISNTQQVRIAPGSVNEWNGSYDSGGNYWSDYIDKDSFSGPLQNETGSDGIVDTPYLIDANNKDKYPLMKPYGGPRDVGAIVSISKTVLAEGYSTTVAFNVTTINYGAQAEDFNFTFSMPGTPEFETEITLGNRKSTTFTFTLNTTGFPVGNYTISSFVSTVPGETDTQDNNHIIQLRVVIPGDISSTSEGVPDGMVNMRDVNYSILLFNTRPGTLKWNPNADINDDQVVNMRDIQIAILNFNKHE
jgi:parallel beta-helix repeat protein